MRRKIAAGVLMTLVFLIPAAPAVAQAAQPGLNEACQTVERTVFKDLRKLVTIDLDTATDIEVRLLANQILAEVKAESLTVLPTVLQERLDGPEAELRAFLKTDLESAWAVALRVAVTRTLVKAGPNVEAAAKKVLGEPTIDAYLVYLNDGVYAARELDCASQPSPSPSATTTTAPAPGPSDSAAPGASASPTASGDSDNSGDSGGLPVTGDNTGAVAGIGGALLLLGGAGYLIGRRRRARFEA